MILDHIAIRCKDRYVPAECFTSFLGYRHHTSFDLKFDDGSTTDCLVLVPGREYSGIPRVITQTVAASLGDDGDFLVTADYQIPPEIFISDGPPESIVGKWVEKNGPGVHHLAFRVNPGEIESYMTSHPTYEWLSKEPIVCDGLRQIFVKMPGTNLTIELIEREKEGFCRDSVKKLMESTK